MWKLIAPGIAMIAVTYAFARYSFGLFLPDISAALNLSESQAGTVGSAAYAAYTLALLASSGWIRKYGAQRIVLCSGMTAFVGILGMVFSQGFYTLAFSAFVAGLGSGWISPAFSQVVAQSMRPGLQDKGNTWINTGTSFGIVFTGLAALLFAEEWRWSYGLFAILTSLVFWWNAVAIKEAEEKPAPPAQRLFSSNTLKKARFLIAASLGVGFCSSIYWTFSRTYITEIHGLSLNESVVFWMVMGASGVVGGIAGSIIQSFGLRLSYRLGVMAVALSIAGLTISQNAAIYLSAIFFGIAFIFMTGLFIVWGTRQFPETPSVGVSISFFSLGIGQSLGSAIAGNLIEATSYPFAFLLFSAIGFIFVFGKTAIVPSKGSA